MIGRMARAAGDALAVVEETERRHRHETVVDEALQASEIVERQSRRAHRAAYEARMTAKHIAFGADDALGAMMAATLPRSTMSKEQMQSIAHGARPKTARPKKEKKESKPWTKEDVTKLKKACKEVPSTVEKQQRWRQISGIVGRGKRECYDKYKELKEAQKTKNELKATMSRAAEGSTFEERLAALGLKEPAADGAAAPASGRRRRRRSGSAAASRRRHLRRRRAAAAAWTIGPPG